MANNADGSTWTEAEPALSDPRSFGQQEIRALRVGLRKRLEKEHDTPAASTAGGEHIAGSAKAYYQDATPDKRPDEVNDPLGTGGTALTADDNGRLWVDTDGNLRYYKHSAWKGAVGVNPSGNTDISGDVNTAAGWENTTGTTVFAYVACRHTASITLEVDYGGGFVTFAQSVQTSGASSQFLLFANVFVPPSALIRLNPDSVASPVRARYQTLT